MEKVISLLFDIERKANQIIERANVEKDALLDENEKAIALMENNIAEENRLKINSIIAKADKELELEKNQLIENSDKKLKDLELHYNKDHDAMVEKVFKSIINI